MTRTVRTRLLIAAAAAGLLVCAGLLVRQLFFAKEKTAYISAPAVRMDMEESVLASGVLKAFKSVAVGAQVSGQLKKVHVALGDKVRKGQLLAEIDPVLQRNTLRDAEAQVDNLRAQKASRQALLKQYELAFKRQKRMLAQDASARSDLESAQASLESTAADIASLGAQVQKALIAVDTARANLGYTRIIAPMDGVVISLDTEEGQTVVSNMSATTIITLANLDTITVKAKISEADITRVKAGQTTYFTILGDSGTRYYSRLRAIEPGPVTTSSTSSSSNAVYYNGLFEVPNPDNRLRVSMTAQVSIVLSQARQALCIPVASLGDKSADGRQTVRVMAGKGTETRRIRTGISNNVFVQVVDGLRDGESVVVGDSTSLPAAETSGRPPGPPGRR